MACNRNQQKHNRAFGLVELMVSISIMMLVTTVMLTRQSAFNGAVLLRNQAYEVAFTICQAQLLAVSGKDQTARRYGVHFDLANNQEYIMFKDLDGDDGGYEGSGDQVGLTGRLDHRFELTATYPISNTQTLDIIFERPNFDLDCDPECLGNATVNIRRKGGNGPERQIVVTPAGQISVVSVSP